MGALVRLFGGRSNSPRICHPFASSTVRRARPAAVDGFAISTNVRASAGPPISPPATTHRLAVVVAPGELCASYQKFDVSAGPGHHIVRSATIGTPLVERTTIDSDTLANGRNPEPGGSCSSSTQIVDRELPATV